MNKLNDKLNEKRDRMLASGGGAAQLTQAQAASSSVLIDPVYEKIVVPSSNGQGIDLLNRE